MERESKLLTFGDVLYVLGMLAALTAFVLPGRPQPKPQPEPRCHCCAREGE